jgi:hypothetical protein
LGNNPKSSHAVKSYVQNKSLAIEYEYNFPARGPELFKMM